jgi:hypothetical protein
MRCYLLTRDPALTHRIYFFAGLDSQFMMPPVAALAFTFSYRLFDILGVGHDTNIVWAVRAFIIETGHAIPSPTSAFLPVSGLLPQPIPFRECELPFNTAQLCIGFLMPIAFDAALGPMDISDNLKIFASRASETGQKPAQLLLFTLAFLGEIRRFTGALIVGDSVRIQNLPDALPADAEIITYLLKGAGRFEIASANSRPVGLGDSLFGVLFIHVGHSTTLDTRLSSMPDTASALIPGIKTLAPLRHSLKGVLDFFCLLHQEYLTRKYQAWMIVINPERFWIAPEAN